MEWWNSRITKTVIRRIEQEREYLLEEIASGKTLVTGETEAKTNRIVGNIEGLDFFLQRTFADD